MLVLCKRQPDSYSTLGRSGKVADWEGSLMCSHFHLNPALLRWSECWGTQGFDSDEYLDPESSWILPLSSKCQPFPPSAPLLWCSLHFHQSAFGLWCSHPPLAFEHPGPKSLVSGRGKDEHRMTMGWITSGFWQMASGETPLGAGFDLR